jgi:hypothetical protein
MVPISAVVPACFPCSSFCHSKGHWKRRGWAWQESHDHLFPGAAMLGSLRVLGSAAQAKSAHFQLPQSLMVPALCLVWLPALNHSSPGLCPYTALSVQVYVPRDWILFPALQASL